MTEFQKYQTLINDYLAFENRYWSTAFNEEKKKVLALQKEFKGLEENLTAINATESPFYNIFQVMNVRHYEEKLHTPFLCNLLNPRGSHGQGAFFLDLFFKDVLQKGYRYENISHFNLHEEHRTDKGRIDIICSFNVNQERIGIIIENKIHAPDQPNQLQRYYDYLSQVIARKKRESISSIPLPKRK